MTRDGSSHRGGPRRRDGLRVIESIWMSRTPAARLAPPETAASQPRQKGLRKARARSRLQKMCTSKSVQATTPPEPRAHEFFVHRSFRELHAGPRDRRVSAPATGEARTRNAGNLFLSRRVKVQRSATGTTCHDLSRNRHLKDSETALTDSGNERDFTVE